MAERKLGEQWVEQGFHDNKMHLYKAVENPYETCQGCTFGCESCDVCHYCLADGGKCPVNKMDMVIKDLGILNEDGCLPSVWSNNLYPQVYRTTETIWYAHAESYGIFMEAKGKTKQEAIDAWNRRMYD